MTFTVKLKVLFWLCNLKDFYEVIRAIILYVSRARYPAGMSPLPSVVKTIVLPSALEPVITASYYVSPVIKEMNCFNHSDGESIPGCTSETYRSF